MRSNPSLAKVVVVLIALLVCHGYGCFLSAQAPIPTAQQLDQLLAPIALYPDSLLAQITTASTNPQEILDVSNWLQQNQGLQGAALTNAAEEQGFDAAFIALVNFPDVLNMMAENIDDFAAIGQAFSADQGAVSASIQRLRAQAYAAGNLQSNQQQQVAGAAVGRPADLCNSARKSASRLCAGLQPHRRLCQASNQCRGRELRTPDSARNFDG